MFLSLISRPSHPSICDNAGVRRPGNEAHRPVLANSNICSASLVLTHVGANRVIFNPVVNTDYNMLYVFDIQV